MLSYHKVHTELFTLKTAWIVTTKSSLYPAHKPETIACKPFVQKTFIIEFFSQTEK